jgi:hypothetical protein
MQIQPIYMDMKTLLSGRLFRIPEYQRAYSWQTKQRQDFFEDLKKVGRAGSGTEHFMAAIVGLRRKKIRIQADQFTQIEVVDGQQRLTTIAILLKAISKDLDRKDSVQSRLAVDLEELLVKRDKTSPLLIQTNQDLSNHFSDYMRTGAHPAATEATTAADRNLLEAIAECETFVQEWIGDGFATLVDLVDILRNRLTLILHEIEDEGLVYTVFEVLNSRGLDVTWFDKLKSLLMAAVFESGGGNKAATIDELHQIWREIYRTIGLRQILNKETVRFAGTLRSKVRPNRPLDEESAVRELTSACGGSPRKVLDLCKWLLSVTRAEERVLSNHRWRAVTTIVQARIVAIAVILRGFSQGETTEILRRWENVTFRIYGMADKDARAHVGDYVRLAWRISNEALSAKLVMDGLSEIGADYPVRATVKNLINSNRYEGWTEEVRYFFFRYDEYLARKRGVKFNESQWNKIWAEEPSRSIEHVRPQSKGPWTASTSGVFVHRLGNLLLLPPGVNSRLSDKDPREKGKEYEHCGLLAATEVAKILKKNIGKWDRKTVERRENSLVRWAATEWVD